MEKNKFCPCCGRHCDLSNPKCERGEEYLRTGEIETKQSHGKGRPSKEERLAHYQAADIQDKLIINLRDMNHVMRFLYEGKGSQKRILIILNEVGNITQKELTERLGIQPGSASEVIAKLEESGHIVRIPSESDRRTMNIVLTEQGRVLAETATAQRQKRHEEMFSCLSDEEKSILLDLLEKINGDWENRYRGTEEEHRHGGRHHGEHCHGEHGHEEHGHGEHVHGDHGHGEHGHEEHGHGDHGHEDHGHGEHEYGEHGHHDHRHHGEEKN